jgi:hypothetical protein
MTGGQGQPRYINYHISFNPAHAAGIHTAGIMAGHGIFQPRARGGKAKRVSVYYIRYISIPRSRRDLLLPGQSGRCQSSNPAHAAEMDELLDNVLDSPFQPRRVRGGYYGQVLCVKAICLSTPLKRGECSKSLNIYIAC